MRRLPHAGLLVLSTCLFACGPSRQDTLGQWMQEQRKAAVSITNKRPAPQAFTHLPYEQGQRKDPFDRQYLLALANAQADQANPDLGRPQTSLARQPLEDIPLESMNFVGMMQTQGRCVGLVRANGILHQVATGQSIGKNFGKVWHVDASGIELRERVQDAAGKWSERDAYLRLQEGSK